MIYCTQCKTKVNARLTNGKETYPHRPDLHNLPFWKCDACKNFVGCHHKTKTPTKPLGCIPSSAIKRYRKMIHAVIDPLWQSKQVNRDKLYAMISKELGRQYHTAEIRSEQEAKEVYLVAIKIAKILTT